ncbi:protein-glutamate O-methyltransferase-like isoform X1 [Trichogramma pretiosum]|uniref:protein-glutamate O-methyltransferase-like isoform X1 n=2 Tax=Trichogramma pretiosum TaxID=7493 RepID=UPI0006C9ACD2|nr:protein-glutamate O-methyltransferase-like isoform X1 [Trichogramma pretiosum]
MRYLHSIFRKVNSNIIQTRMAQKITQRSNSSDIGCLEDIEPPINKFLRGKYKRSFAHKTIKDRLPVILTKVVDNLSRNKDAIVQEKGAEATQEIKTVIGAVSKLRNELMTNKALLPLEPLPGRTNDDTQVWNDKIEKLSKEEGETQTWYNAIWLISECYMYRRMAQELMSTKHLKTYDPFEIQKQEGFTMAATSVAYLAEYVLECVHTKKDEASSVQHLSNLMKLNLWGNRCDLSLSAGVVSSKEFNPLDSLEKLNKQILVDDSHQVSEFLVKNQQSGNTNSTIDTVLDNAGYELFTDLCLAIYILEKSVVKKMRFYVKRYPWFVSDVMTKDFHWLIEIMKKSDNQSIQTFGGLCEKHLKSGAITIEEESFWTDPYDFSEMPTHDQTLYKKLSEAILVIFKGDLNYRKLMGDVNWETTTDFTHALRGFQPSRLVSFRTIKADVCSGLPQGVADSLKKEDPHWMETGRFGLIQASFPNK